jgi:hypothetical protein
VATKKQTVKKANKKIVKVPKTRSVDAKHRKKPNYKSFKLHRSIKHHEATLPSWWYLLRKSFALLAANKKQIFVFFLIYGFLNLLLVRGFSSTVDIEGIRETFNEVVDSDGSSMATAITAFSILLDSTTQGTNQGAQSFQTVLLIVSSLAIIWLYRQQQAGSKVTMKMAFYKGMYPLIPFLLVVAVMGFQLIPAVLGNFLLTSVVQAGLIVGVLEQVLWTLFFISMLLWSFYMISSSAIALYIVTLPDMTPIRALRQAKELVHFRRFSILRKTVAVAIILVTLLTIIVIPVIFLFPVLAEWIFFSITVLAIPLAHGYMFTLYRELL